MLSTFLELKEPLIYISKNTSNLEYKKLFLKSEEWAEIEELKKIFEVFLGPSVKLQGQTYTTLPQGFLYIYIIFKDLERKLSFYNSYKDSVSFIFIFILKIFFNFPLLILN